MRYFYPYLDIEKKTSVLKRLLKGDKEAWNEALILRNFNEINYTVMYAHFCHSMIPAVGHLFQSKPLEDLKRQCERVFICPKDDPHYNPMTNYLEKDIRKDNPVKSLLIIPTEDDRVNPLHSIEFSNLFPNSHYLLLPMDHNMGGKITNYKDERKLLPEEEVMFEATRNFFLDEDPLKRYKTNRTLSPPSNEDPRFDEEAFIKNKTHHTIPDEEPLRDNETRHTFPPISNEELPKEDELKKHPLPPVLF